MAKPNGACPRVGHWELPYESAGPTRRTSSTRTKREKGGSGILITAAGRVCAGCMHTAPRARARRLRQADRDRADGRLGSAVLAPRVRRGRLRARARDAAAGARPRRRSSSCSRRPRRWCCRRFEPNPLARDETRPATGHIDVAFTITKYGRGRDVEIRDAANATEAAQARPRRPLEEQSVPAAADGRRSSPTRRRSRSATTCTTERTRTALEFPRFAGLSRSACGRVQSFRELRVVPAALIQ